MKLRNPPIIEAVVDIDCDLPPSLDIAELESRARDAFRGIYARFRPVYRHQAELHGDVGTPLQVSTRQGIGALQFLSEDERQIVQVRTQGFSFNRLAPYTTLDDYLSEIERTWQLFVDIAAPIRIRRVGLQYINRLMLPLTNGVVDLDDYLRIGPRLAEEEGLVFVSFANQHEAVEKETNNRVRIVMASQPEDAGRIPVILDIAVSRPEDIDPVDWSSVHLRIDDLRRLKNLLFEKSVTTRVLEDCQ